MQQQDVTPLSPALQALELLNESADHVYALTYNPRNAKWVTLRLARVRGITDALAEGGVQPATFRVMSFSGGNTPEIAVRDALRLRYAPERTVDSDY